MGKLNINEFERLYMAGYTDYRIAKILGVGKATAKYHRSLNDWPPNHELFKWQKELNQDELAKIPERYRRAAE